MTIVSARVLAITSRFIPTPVMRKMLRSITTSSKTVLTAAQPIVSVPTMTAPAPSVHTCWDYMEEYDGDGPSPAEYCNKCQNEMREYNIQAQKEREEAERNFDPSKYATDGYCTWDEIQEQKSAEMALYAAYDVQAIMALDERRGTMKSWWYYYALSEEGTMTPTEREEKRKREFEEYKEFKANQEKYGYWYVSPKEEEERQRIQKNLEEYKLSLKTPTKAVQVQEGNGREYIRSIDARSGKVREKEFQEWLATPKNVRPIYLEKGRLGRPIARGETYSVLIKDCFAHILSCDIRLFFARFGGIRDLYRPIDRVRGIAKPIAFLEMVRYEDAMAVVKYFENHECIIDDNVLLVEMAETGRKTTAQMAIVEPSVALAPIAQNKKITEQKIVEKKKITGAFAALMNDSDSD